MEKTLYPEEPILLIHDENPVFDAMSALMEEKGFTNKVLFRDSPEVMNLLEQRRFSCVIMDIDMPYLSGKELLSAILHDHPDIPVIVLTGASEVDVAVQCMKAGAFDYINKPAEPMRLFTSLRHAVEKRELGDVTVRLRESLLSTTIRNPQAFDPIVARSKAMLDIFRYIEAISSTSLPVLISGETGTGKELMARAVHVASGRKGAFVPVNVAGLDDELFSDTLFGHTKGAYTGAATEREGMIWKASRGTLFLDEIGDLSLVSQLKLLRLLQEREYYPLGSDATKTTDARFVFATSHDLESASTSGAFRKDLFYRLRSHRIEIPPLRERPEDIPLLVDHFLEKAAREMGKKPPKVPKEIYALLSSYCFSGNIRELEGILSDAVVRHESGMLSLRRLQADLDERKRIDAPFRENKSIDANPFASLETLPSLKIATQLLIDEAMSRAGGNQTLAAHLLGMSRTTLNKKLKL